MDYIKMLVLIYSLSYLSISSSFAFHRILRQRKQSLSHIYESSIINNAIVAEDYIVYDGPIASFDRIEHGLSIEDLGLDVMIGPSTIPNTGLGLFVSVCDDVDEVFLERGTVLCGYSRGYFHHTSIGTKTVGFAFDSLQRGVFYNKKLMSLYDVVTKEFPSSSSNETKSISDALEGHVILYDNSTQVFVIYPDDEYTGNRYFIPDDDHIWTPGYGMYANDLAYHANITYEAYQQSSSYKNILCIIWRVDYNETSHRLQPTWPIVMLNQDVMFRNIMPMEIGLTYTWKYWEAARLIDHHNGHPHGHHTSSSYEY